MYMAWDQPPYLHPRIHFKPAYPLCRGQQQTEQETLRRASIHTSQQSPSFCSHLVRWTVAQVLQWSKNLQTLPRTYQSRSTRDWRCGRKPTWRANSRRLNHRGQERTWHNIQKHTSNSQNEWPRKRTQRRLRTMGPAHHPNHRRKPSQPFFCYKTTERYYRISHYHHHIHHHHHPNCPHSYN